MACNGMLSSGKKGLRWLTAIHSSCGVWVLAFLQPVSWLQDFSCIANVMFQWSLSSAVLSVFLLTKLLGRSQAPCFCLQPYGPGQGSKGKSARHWQEQHVESSLLAVSHPPELPERKRSFVFSACSWLSLLLGDRKNKASFDYFYF